MGTGFFDYLPECNNKATWKRMFLWTPTIIDEATYKWAWLRYVYVKEFEYRWHGDGSKILEYKTNEEDCFLENL